MRILLLVVFGSAGTVARYALEGFVHEQAGSSFPTGTLTVNLLGCFLLGVTGQYALLHISIPPDWRVAITVGFFGAFTTFSTFSWEIISMMQDGDWRRAAVYLATCLVGGLFLLALGMRLAERI